MENVIFLAERISQIVEERTGLQVNCGVASFPDEALTFEDLLYLARERSKKNPLSANLVEVKEKILK